MQQHKAIKLMRFKILFIYELLGKTSTLEGIVEKT